MKKQKPSSKDEKAAYGKDDAQPEVMTVEQSFKDSANHALNGTKLEPYTVERMWAADSMGLRWGRLSTPAAKQFATDNTYPGMSGDVGIVMWLCSTTDLEEIRCARRDPSPAEDKAIAFSEKHKIASPKQKEFWQAYAVFLNIMTEVHVAYAEPEKKTEKEATTATAK
jgi:hypothetical protein